MASYLVGAANCQLHMHYRKRLSSSSTHHPFVSTSWGAQTIPVSLAQGSEKVLWGFYLFSTPSKSQPWCFCNSTLAVVLCSLGHNWVRTPAAWDQVPPVAPSCPGWGRRDRSVMWIHSRDECIHMTLITWCLAGRFENIYRAPSSVSGIGLQMSMHIVPFNSYFSPGK